MKYTAALFEVDGLLSYRRAQVLGGIIRSLDEKLMKLRNLDGFVCKGAFLYSRPIDIPEIPNTDFLFAVPKK